MEGTVAVLPELSAANLRTKEEMDKTSSSFVQQQTSYKPMSNNISLANNILRKRCQQQVKREVEESQLNIENDLIMSDEDDSTIFGLDKNEQAGTK